MSILNRLIGRMHSVFNKDPKPVVAGQIITTLPANTVEWECNNGTLKLYASVSTYTFTGSQTLSTVRAYIAFYTSDEITITVPTDYLERTCSSIIDTPRQTVADSPYITLPTSAFYGEMKTYALALNQQSEQIKAASMELFGDTADGEWLEYWFATHFGIFREQEESDAAYFQRVKYELFAIRTNNKALEKLVYDALGVKIQILDAYGEGHTDDEYIGRFYIKNLPYSSGQALIKQRIKDVCRRSKAAGTDFLEGSLAHTVNNEEAVAVTDVVVGTVTATFSDSLTTGYIYVGAGWTVGSTGVLVGLNAAILEEAVVSKVFASTGVVDVQYYLT